MGTASSIFLAELLVCNPLADKSEDTADDLQKLYMGLAAAQANDRCLL